ncbi:hypothetical protein VNO78_07242 [Psophocarpus tetragonolobus]|uniref:Uncharacterized protein n=1 Tax=Psophocarpus tetragonolobus TaxID=3891 RepID=A0AAN9SUC4_PSOTE
MKAVRIEGDGTSIVGIYKSGAHFNIELEPDSRFPLLSVVNCALKQSGIPSEAGVFLPNGQWEWEPICLHY